MVVEELNREQLVKLKQNFLLEPVNSKDKRAEKFLGKGAETVHMSE